jgi:hypothetical protein
VSRFKQAAARLAQEKAKEKTAKEAKRSKQPALLGAQAGGAKGGAGMRGGDAKRKINTLELGKVLRMALKEKEATTTVDDDAQKTAQEQNAQEKAALEKAPASAGEAKRSPLQALLTKFGLARLAVSLAAEDIVSVADLAGVEWADMQEFVEVRLKSTRA